MTNTLKVCLSIFAIFFGSAVVVHANSLGVGGSEQAIIPSGPFADILYWIQQQQQAFYKSLNTSLQAIKAGEESGMWLVFISFLYGVFHAAGPGHGKAVISMYMIANEVQLKKGVVLSFASAFLQAVVAILCILALVLVLRGIGYRSADLTKYLEICSYGAVTLLGAWLLWRKFFGGGHSHHHDEGHSHAHSHENDHAHNHVLAHDHTHHDHPDHVCDAGCGHAHFPDPKDIPKKLTFNSALAAVLSVGIRPCTGALIVLTFAFFNGLHAYGIASAFGMAIGTGLTVSILATIAVLGKNFAVKILNIDGGSARFTNAIEIFGALLVFLLGLTLLSASLQ